MSSVLAFLCTSLMITLHVCRSDDSSRGSSASSGTNSASTNLVYYSKCDPVIVAKIYKVWDYLYGGWPTDVIKKSKNNGEEVVISTTENYYGSDLKCLSSYVYDTFVITKSVYKNGTCIPKNITISECEGRSISVSKGVNPRADNKPDGFMKVASKGYSKVAVSEGYAIMKNLGIPLKVQYTLHCDCDECEY